MSPETIRGRVGQGGDEVGVARSRGGPEDQARRWHTRGFVHCWGSACPELPTRGPVPGRRPGRRNRVVHRAGPAPAPPRVQAVAAALCEGAPGCTGLPVGWSRTCPGWAGPVTTRAVADSMRRQGPEPARTVAVPGTTQAGQDHAPWSADLINRNFTAAAPNRTTGRRPGARPGKAHCACRPQVDLHVHTMYPAGDSPVHGPGRVMFRQRRSRVVLHPARTWEMLSRNTPTTPDQAPATVLDWYHDSLQQPPTPHQHQATPPPRHPRHPQPRRITEPSTNKGEPHEEPADPLTRPAYRQREPVPHHTPKPDSHNNSQPVPSTS